MSLRLLVAGFVLVGALACGGEAPQRLMAPTPTPAPTQVNLGGAWNGTYASAQLGYGRAVLALSQNGTSVSGTWSSNPDAGGGNGVGSGTINGIVATGATTFTLTLAPSDPRNCPFVATMEYLSSLRQMVGQWVTTNCTVSASGTLILAKI